MDVDTFIQRWTAREGGAERVNYKMFQAGLCDVISVVYIPTACQTYRGPDRVVGYRTRSSPAARRDVR